MFQQQNDIAVQKFDSLCGALCGFRIQKDLLQVRNIQISLIYSKLKMNVNANAYIKMYLFRICHSKDNTEKEMD